LQAVHKFYSQFTGQTVQRIEEETDRDLYMSAQQAIDMGIIDSII
jgi:ATP-dependent Clp protease protease subunit